MCISLYPVLYCEFLTGSGIESYRRILVRSCNVRHSAHRLRCSIPVASDVFCKRSIHGKEGKMSIRLAVGYVALVAAAWAGSPGYATEEVPFEEGKGPPAAAPGETWCLVERPATYKTVTNQVKVRDEVTVTKVLPAEYAWQEEQIRTAPERKIATVVPCSYKTETVTQLVKEGCTRMEVVPAQYEWVEEEVVIESAREIQKVIPARFETRTEQVLVEPEHTVTTTHESNMPGKFICVKTEKVPARYRTVTKTEKVENEHIVTETIPAVTKTVKVHKLVKDCYVREVKTEPEYQSITRTIIDKPETIVYETVPAKFETIKKRVLVRPEERIEETIPARFESLQCTVLDQPARLVWQKQGYVEIIDKYGAMPGSAVLAAR